MSTDYKPAPEVKRREISDTFDQIEARKNLTDQARELLKKPVVQSLLYDINLLPEQITTGKHWFYMLSVLSHMDSVMKPVSVSLNKCAKAATKAHNEGACAWDAEAVSRAVLEAAGMPYVD